MAAISVAVAGCSNHPTHAEKALIAFVEQHVMLAKGSPGPQCYKRYYRLVEGDELGALLPGLAQQLRGFLHWRLSYASARNMG